jgi:hypothetical protein
VQFLGVILGFLNFQTVVLTYCQGVKVWRLGGSLHGCVIMVFELDLGLFPSVPGVTVVVEYYLGGNVL